MIILLWVLQALTALIYTASGVMKVFRFDKVSADVSSFGALPKGVWAALGVLELACVVGLIVPSALRWQTSLTVVLADQTPRALPLSRTWSPHDPNFGGAKVGKPTSETFGFWSA